MCNINNIPKTSIPEDIKQLMNTLGFGLGLNREGNYYITDNKKMIPMMVEENADGTTLATALNNSKGLTFKVGNCCVDGERQITRPIFDVIRINDLQDKSILEVTRHTSSNTPNSDVQIKLDKNFNGSNFKASVNLFSNGTINVFFGNVKTFSCSLDENEEYSITSSMRILANLELVDERIIPIIEYYANNYPLISQTLTKIKETCAEKTANTRKRLLVHPKTA